MNRRKFTQSWGRKLFFGLSWPLSMIFGLVYLRSFIFPQSAEELLYFILTYVGHFGVLNILVYYFLFSPIVLLMPSYYISRMWSLLLIVLLNGVILLDAISFSSFHLHLFSFISPLLIQEGIENLFPSKIVMWIAALSLFISAIMIWIKGERNWRFMQGRFSNPVSNWYLYLILFFFIAGKAVFYLRPVNPQLAKVFPLNLVFKDENKTGADNRRFFYSADKVTCKSKKNPNIVMLVLKEWNSEQFNPEMMPKIFHLKDHSVFYSAHLNVGHNSRSGKFSLLYSLPASYQTLSQFKQPAFFSVMNKRGYEMVEIESDRNLASLDTWLQNRSGDEIQPLFLSMFFEENALLADTQVDEVILKLEQNGLLKDSYVIITGSYSGPGSQIIPLLISSPERKADEVTHITTVYDVVPSLMENFWECGSVFKKVSIGKPLKKSGRDWFLASIEGGFKIVDLKNDNILQVKDGGLTVFGTNPRYKLIFNALKIMTKFNRPH
ncbi:MAG: DUF3413 domain-containing protein [Bacteriovoracia bacterium]